MQSWISFVGQRSSSRNPSASSFRAVRARKRPRACRRISGDRSRCRNQRISRSRQRRRYCRTERQRSIAGGRVRQRPAGFAPAGHLHAAHLRGRCRSWPHAVVFQSTTNAQGSRQMPAPLCAPKSGRTTSSSRPSWRASLQPSSSRPSSWQPLYNSFQGGSFPGDSPVNRWVSPPRHHDGNSCTAPKGALLVVASVHRKQRARDCQNTHQTNRRTSILPTRLFKDSNRASTTGTISFGANSRAGMSPRRARGPSRLIRRTQSRTPRTTHGTALSTILL